LQANAFFMDDLLSINKMFSSNTLMFYAHRHHSKR
jgi:hypothetical protein